MHNTNSTDISGQFRQLSDGGCKVHFYRKYISNTATVAINHLY